MSDIQYAEGDVIEYRDFLGDLRVVRVELKEDDIKNGMPGFDGTVVSGPEKSESVWGYDYQIERKR